MYEIEDVIIVDDDEDDDDYRNARSNVADKRGGGGRRLGRSGSRRPRRSPRGGRAIIRADRRPVSPNTGSIIRRDTGGLSVGKMVQMGAQLFAAIQPLPPPPAPTGKAEIDIANSVLYHAALAEHAKRDEQLRTVGQIVSKLFA